MRWLSCAAIRGGRESAAMDGERKSSMIPRRRSSNHKSAGAQRFWVPELLAIPELVRSSQTESGWISPNDTNLYIFIYIYTLSLCYFLLCYVLELSLFFFLFLNNFFFKFTL